MSNEISFEVLWDTGVQISIAPRGWLGEHLPSSKLRDIEELLRDEAGQNLKGANG